jgi:heme/copper-type cytochrome/quinol oxidase subunit 3
MSTTAAHTFAEARLAAHRSGTAFLGMVIFMASWAMLFAGLFFAYGMVRAGTHSWPPTDLPPLPLGWPGVATAALVLSSVALQAALSQARKSRKQVGAFTLGAFAAGVVFLNLQISVWRHLWTLGLRPETGTYASVFYGLTVFHALHVAVGLVALLYLAVQGQRHRYNSAFHIPLRLWTLYWHMVGVVWVLMYVLLYLV